MIKFGKELTAAGCAIIEFCIRNSLGKISFERGRKGARFWEENYPLSSQCFCRHRTCKTLEEILEKLNHDGLYELTDYHWLLLYECLGTEINCFNTTQARPLWEELQQLKKNDDIPYLSVIKKRRKKQKKILISFTMFFDMYFPKIDFLMSGDEYNALSAEDKAKLHFSEELFGVVNDLIPHPDELILWPTGNFCSSSRP